MIFLHSPQFLLGIAIGSEIFVSVVLTSALFN